MRNRNTSGESVARNPRARVRNLEAERAVKELESLRRTFARVALTALVLVYFALTGLTVAMDRVNGEEMRKELEPLRGISRVNLDASYVFSQQLAEIPAGTRDAPEVVQERSARLEKLAKEWFGIEFELLGTKLRVDLRFVAPALPILVMLVGAYLWVTLRKTCSIEAYIASELQTEEESVWNSPHFRRHPYILLQIMILIAALVLVAWLIGIFGYFLRDLVATDLQIDYADAVLWMFGCLILYVSDVTPVAGDGSSDRRLAARLRRGLAWVRRTMLPEKPLRWIRARLLIASSLVLATLFTVTATSCSGDRRTGYEYIRAAHESIWFNQHASLMGLTDNLMRPLYIATVVVAAVGLLVAFLPRRQASGRTLKVAAASSRIAANVSLSALLLVICSACTFCRASDLGEISDAVAVILFAVIWLWLWGARRFPEKRAQRWVFVGLALTSAALTFGLQSALFLWSHALIGVPLFAFGAALQFVVLRQMAVGSGSIRDRPV